MGMDGYATPPGWIVLLVALLFNRYATSTRWSFYKRYGAAIAMPPLRGGVSNIGIAFLSVFHLYEVVFLYMCVGVYKALSEGK